MSLIDRINNFSLKKNNNNNNENKKINFKNIENRKRILKRSQSLSGCFSENKDIARPPILFQRSSFLVRVYYVNHAWKSVIIKSFIVAYMIYIWTLIFMECDPWYEFFYYLTLQGWTLELSYFLFSLYLDLLCRYYGGSQFVSRISKAAAQALSELVFATQVVIVLFFWIIVYPKESWRNIYWELNCHGVGLVLIVCDYLYRFTGFSLRNHRYVVGFALLYSSLHIYVVVYLRKPIYPGIDFKSISSFVTFFAGLSTVVFTHKVFYLITNWKWVKEDVKNLLGISKVILFRQNSFDTLMMGVAEFGGELLSISPKSRTTSMNLAIRGNRSSSPNLSS